jgi:shikimate dehydrogenase
MILMDISGKTKICGVIGDPISHSLSPIIQNSAFCHLNLDVIYLAFKVQTKDLQNFIQFARSFGILGLNVTMPHKEKIISYLDEVDSTANFLNSVNTIINNKGKLSGYSTDGIGALNALQKNGVNLASSQILLLGAGGAGRAIAFSLADKVSNLVILNRDSRKVNNLVSELNQRFNTTIHSESLSSNSIKKHIKDSNILINATNIGMKSNPVQSIVDSSVLFADLTVMDIVYNPIETKLLSDSKKVGAKIINGLDMLIYQGAASFELWTCQKAPIKVMKNAAIKKILDTGVIT